MKNEGKPSQRLVGAGGEQQPHARIVMADDKAVEQVVRQHLIPGRDIAECAFVQDQRIPVLATEYIGRVALTPA